ncbi:MAG: class I SAM-dependent methyltransferase [Hyphomicrobiaceae bacterium]
MAAQPPNVVVDFDGLDLELYFVTEVLKLGSLHYGLFPPDAPRPVTIDAIRAAQARYTERLLSHVPSGVRTVLDVGAGIGDNARAFAAKGYQVTAISPDKNHQRYFEADRHPGITFHRSKYEDLSLDQRFDLLLFSESLNYFDRETGLRQSRRFVAPGGAMLVAAMFHQDGWAPYPDDFKLESLPFVAMARAHGFELELAEDITEATSPTMEAVHYGLSQQLKPLIVMGEHFLKASSPWKAWAIQLAFGKQIRELEKLLAYYEHRTHPDTFRKVFRYAILRLRDTARTA